MSSSSPIKMEKSVGSPVNLKLTKVDSNVEEDSF